MRLSPRICCPYCAISSRMSVESFSGTPKYHFTFTSDETFASRYRISGVNSSAGVCVCPSPRDCGQCCCVCLGRAAGPTQENGTYGVVRVDLLLLDRLAVGQAHDHPRGLLGVPSHSDVDASRALGDQRHQVEKRWLDIRAVTSVSVSLTAYMRLVDATHPFRPTICANRTRYQQPNSQPSSRTGDYACGAESRDDQCRAHESSHLNE